MSRRSERFRQIDKNIARSAACAEDPQFNAAICERARRRMMRVDEMPPDIRRMVYEYGLEIVQEFLAHGVMRASSIKHLVDTVRAADFANGQPRFKINKGPNTKRNPAEQEDEYYSLPSQSQGKR